MKEKLFILPGWRESVESFKEIENLLNEKFETTVITLPGFHQKTEKPYTFEDYLKYLDENFKTIDNFYLLGHSFGGALAMLYALKNPKKIKKLILYNPALIREKTLKQRIITTIVKILKPFESFLPNYFRYLFKKFFYRFIVKSYDYFLVDENMKKTFANINKDLSDLVKNLKVETFLLWGEKDKITPFKHGLRLKKLIPQAKLIPLAGGHNYHRENPKKFAEIVKNSI